MVRPRWHLSRDTTFESSVGNGCILRGPGNANGWAAPSGTHSSYAGGFGRFEVFLGTLKGKPNKHQPWVALVPLVLVAPLIETDL